MFDTWEEELADRAMEVFSDAEAEDLRIAVGQLEQPEYVAVYAANHRSDLDALKKNDMPYQVMGDMVLYYMFHAPLGDGRYYQAEVTNKHLESWKMRKSELHNFVLEHSLVSMESKIYPLCEKLKRAGRYFMLPESWRGRGQPWLCGHGTRRRGKRIVLGYLTGT